MSLLHYYETQRSTKRRKISDENVDLDRKESDKPPRSPSPSTGVVDTPPVDEAEHPPKSSQTELETSLPDIETDEQAIQAYEASQAAENAEPGLQVRLRDGVWKKGKSSIYVDAFNLALETVLDEEPHLFSDAETEVFTQWKGLSYESQYLYVHETFHCINYSEMLMV
jgi:Fanconi-associated nuclease 1